MTAPTQSLLLTGGLDAAGAPFLYPAFVIDAPPALPSSGGESRITGRDASVQSCFRWSSP